jgi:NAD+ dependent glucose-6-phosphate dehydrogenase
VTGSNGVIGQVLGRELGDSYHLVGLDQMVDSDHAGYAKVFHSNLDDVDGIRLALDGIDTIVHLATGSGAGWDGLTAVEIEGTKNLLEVGHQHGVGRFILASSNHAVGWHELDILDSRPSDLDDSPTLARPDGLYGAAKVAAEALVRLAAEYYGMVTSVLRIGTMRAIDSPEHYVNHPDFAYLGGPESVRKRLERTWLSHPDCAAVFVDCFTADIGYRVLYPVSRPELSIWPTSVYSWGLQG